MFETRDPCGRKATGRKRSGTRLRWPPLQARRIERGVDGGVHRVIGGRAGETGGDRLQEMIALYDRQRRRPALKQRELLVREREGCSKSGNTIVSRLDCR